MDELVRIQPISPNESSARLLFEFVMSAPPSATVRCQQRPTSADQAAARFLWAHRSGHSPRGGFLPCSSLAARIAASTSGSGTSPASA